MWYLKITTVPVIVGALGIIRKGQINSLTRYVAVQAYIKYENFHFQESFISLAEYNQSDRKIPYKWGSKNIEYI